MEIDLKDFTINLLIIACGVYFWAWYMVIKNEAGRKWYRRKKGG